MKVALIQTDPTVGAFEKNADKIENFTLKARDAGADLAIFHELAVTGYPPRDLLDKPDFVRASVKTLRELAARTGGLIPIVTGHPEPRNEETGRPLYNACSLLSGGNIKLLHRKCLLPTYDVFDEDRYFEPGDKVGVENISGINFGFTICEDIWNDKAFWKRPRYALDPVRELVKDGAEVIVNIAGSPFHRGKGKFREEMMNAVARHHSRPLLYVNQVGGNDSLVFDGRSCAFDACGNLAARAPEFEEYILMVDVPEMKGEIAEPADELDSVRKALVTGLRDYVRKCGFSRVVVGLSGGVDSSLTAALAVDALGKENVTGVGMPGKYSSDHSKSDAKDLAERLGIRYEVVPIEGIHDAFLKELKAPLGDVSMTLTEENMQARIRAVILMAFSNRLEAMLLTTGNKSEMAMGYCTLYGDMAGGLAVISDVPKLMVYRLARLYSEKHDWMPPGVLTKPPSAELRPDQKDTDSLPPYEVLDPILEAYIEENLAPEQIVGRGHDPEVVKRVLNEVDRNEYKRRQAAPGIRVTTKAFGEGRRLPIAQGYSLKL